MSTEKPSRDTESPPDVPTLVRCNCCGEEYDSYLLVRVIDHRKGKGQGKGGGVVERWCCPTDGCEGHGFGHDIVLLDDGEMEGPDWEGGAADFGVDPACEWSEDLEGALDAEFEAEMAAWENLEPEFSSLLGSDIDYQSLRVDGLLTDPTPLQRFDFDDINEDDIPF